MDNNTIIKRISDAISMLEGVPGMTHEIRKRMVICEEQLIQLMQDLDKEEKENAVKKEKHEEPENEE